MNKIDNEKEIVANYISKNIDKFRIVGFGAGSTVNMIINKLSSKAKQSSYLAASFATMDLLLSKKFAVLPLSTLEDTKIECSVDGADMVLLEDNRFIIIKGYGGALVREKILWESSEQIWVAINKSKLVEKINNVIPIEIVPYGLTLVINELKKRFENIQIKLRIIKNNMPFITENHNYILDVLIKDEIEDFNKLNKEIKLITGVVDTGIFVYPRNARVKIFVGKKNNVEIIY